MPTLTPVKHKPGVFSYLRRGELCYCVRAGRNHKRYGFTSIELAWKYRKKREYRQVMGKHLPELLTVTFAEVLPLYWKAFKAKGRMDEVRPRGIIEKHLLPFFKKHNKKYLHRLTAEDGLDYIVTRQQQGASAGTIYREWQVLMRILNLAVAHDYLPKNRLATVEVEKGTKRERPATVEELRRLHLLAGPECWRIVTVELQTGLRQSPLLFLDGARLHQQSDGPWLRFGAAASPLKRLPKETPLTATAWAAIIGGRSSPPTGRLFAHWDNEKTFRRYWATTCELAEIEDLTFHDLRHTFTTRLQDLGVDYEVRQALLGHTMPGKTADYSHGGPGWQKKLREAVTLLETAYPLPDWRQAGRSREEALKRLRRYERSKRGQHDKQAVQPS